MKGTEERREEKGKGAEGIRRGIPCFSITLFEIS
jgi:hypothetical protein